MKKLYFSLLAGLLAGYSSYAQDKIVTTGNNLPNTADAKAADIVIGSDAGTRHDASMMWWSNASASRISNTNDVFYLSVWNTLNSNIGLAANVGGKSFFQGPLGIGTIDPKAKLSIKGSESALLRLNPTTDNGEATIGFNARASETDFSRMWVMGAGGWGKGDYFTLGSTAHGTPSMVMTHDGNVGVMTENPTAVFQVADGWWKTAIGSANGEDLNFGTSYIGFNAARSNNHTWLLHGDGNNNGGSVIYGDIWGNINFAAVNRTGDSDVVYSDKYIKKSIVFQITSTGITHAKEVKVDQVSWPDYVFKPDYKLASLASVKAYIDQNKHLPEMPSAEQVEKEGVGLGVMNKLLTKKVEELTLYLLEQNKQMHSMQKRLQTLEKRVIHRIK